MTHLGRRLDDTAWHEEGPGPSAPSTPALPPASGAPLVVRAATSGFGSWSRFSPNLSISIFRERPICSWCRSAETLIVQHNERSALRKSPEKIWESSSGFENTALDAE